MAYATITDNTPTPGVVLQGDFRVVIIEKRAADTLYLECSEDDFTTVEIVDIIREESRYNMIGNEPRAGVKYRLRCESAPLSGSITYVLGA